MTMNFLNPVNPVTTQTWTNGRHQVRCVKVIQETWDTRTFCFMAEQPVMFFFKPGQFVTLELEIDGEQVMRSYTISSSPSVPYSFSITVKRMPGGVVSNWLHDNLKVNDELAVHGPVGKFNIIDYPAEKYLMLSGGVGITPLMSMVRWLFDTNAAVDLQFVHSSRTPRDIIFHRELEHIFSRIPEFKLHIVCERSDELGEAWAGFRGYLSQAMLELMAPDFMDREIFCCGPTPYMNAVKRLLQENGFDMSRYHEEAFGATPVDVQEEVIENVEQAEAEAEELDVSDMLSVEFSSTGKSVRIQPTETVHTAAAKLGLHIPKACGMGICGTCRVAVTEGEVEMEHNGGITDEDVAEGYILSCCSTPKTNLVVDY
ncbi:MULTISPECIES: hybrid-cluster NAD(P)-dependent oxidoreductase [Halomonas]|uniref:Ferredoxin n=2 Tax=Halomonas TaxID=2745 RepID=A0ABR4WRP1_9GAMM|nr:MULTISPECIES: hybrid-cluster NAD(P)-dependent oxidoreductase [Halomonas]PSJ23214.1 hybrid-cluster NAD(P)-dependent oxidoreductase [Halomonas sp. ND22Bw]KGE77399.1 ferredoxin [Halomonas salina]MDR5890138.1 hybrid-cluster NAD(P)-dependent oxidoreductase [Halomonas salina]RAH37923.1 hybrid-cluster NAD(P)-dependent oxidoreductase [Halomonas sp. SL1]WJY06602.1 hybrid-cluster NAD(P)-dependent oxidoreductase [Halomonas halophila]